MPWHAIEEASHHDGERAAGAQNPVRLSNDCPAGALRQFVHDQAAGDQVDAATGQARFLRCGLEESVPARHTHVTDLPCMLNCL